ncbi:glycosyltransferase family 2 protein [Rhodoferax ferrireducens]|uniref:glycosyltransferase family 2 protein n=1 Tax=Rhodoferax ferrireducens TaxID=192843 RepID=UPI001300542E|nr:glycosyltransferase [Rhodoferax ferrireducens]
MKKSPIQSWIKLHTDLLEKMNKQTFPLVSIIMPVFNTGSFLIEAINSILNQEALFDCELPSFELIVVDDHSNDPKTLEILGGATCSDSRIHVISNQRCKGASGARNTGIDRARGIWIGFLDSDDIWFPQALALRWRCIMQNENVKWTGAHFRLLKPTTSIEGKPVFATAENLIADLDQKNNIPEIKCLPRPVEEFGDSCMIQTTTVLILRTLIVEKGMFNEQLLRAEDYHLWFKCAFDTDLWMTKAEVSFYRIHSGSLTHGNTPKYLYEDAMIELLLKETSSNIYKIILTRRFDFVMQDQCYFYRSQKLFDCALKKTFQWIIKRPLNMSAWKELLACGLRVG